MSLPTEITRTSVQSVSWWNQSNQPLQDNQNVRIDICTDQLFQAWTGFGCAVSELGWKAKKVAVHSFPAADVKARLEGNTLVVENLGIYTVVELQ
jgi:hypothetical protein